MLAIASVAFALLPPRFAVAQTATPPASSSSEVVTLDPFLGTTQTECWQWKTIGAWAVTKCAAIAVQNGSSSPYKGTCGNECAVIH